MFGRFQLWCPTRWASRLPPAAEPLVARGGPSKADSLSKAAARGVGENSDRALGADPKETVSSRANASTEASSRRDGPMVAVDAGYEELCEVERCRAQLMARASEATKALLGPETSLTKLTTVDQRLIVVLDNWIPEAIWQDLFLCLEQEAFRRVEFARPDTKKFVHHMLEYKVAQMRHTQLFSTIKNVVELFFPRDAAESPLDVYRIYTNAVTFGDVGFVHRDANDMDHITCLLYPNPAWAPELAGETMFYDEDGEIAEAVEPHPGRLVLFHGSIMHKGSPPSRLCFGTRFTMAFKLAPVDSTPAAG